MIPNSHKIVESQMTCSLLSELMIKYYGCQSTVAKVLEINRGTLRKYLAEKNDMLLVQVEGKWVPFAPVTRRGEHRKVNIQGLVHAQPIKPLSS